MKVVNRKLSELIPYDKNTKKHDKTQIANVAESIEEYGFVQPVVIDKDSVIVIGHCRVLAAKKLKMKEVPCVCVEDLTPAQVKALRIVDNKTNESPWDIDLLTAELPDLDLEKFDFEFGLDGIGEDPEEPEEKVNPYTMNVEAPVYTPDKNEEVPDLDDLVDRSKVLELETQIQNSTVPASVKKFLSLAAQRHLKFNYKKIAQFYAQADEQTQELFENSALVIIDYNSAIKNGFTKLSKKIEEMRDDE